MNYIKIQLRFAEIGYELPKPIQNKQELESLFAWHNFFIEFASNADEFKDFNPRDE